MHLRPGDHICALYTGDAELNDIVADFLAEGLRNGERCWYVAPSDDRSPLRTALARRDVDLASEIRRGALLVIPPADAYADGDRFEPEQTMATFSDAIERALGDGYAGFRAAAEMSWVLQVPDGAQQLFTYEALLRSLFSTSRAIGLCLYQRDLMPVDVIGGALTTHPLVRTASVYRRNRFYDPAVTSLQPTTRRDVDAKIRRLGGADT